jgi:hypothetical protein
MRGRISALAVINDLRSDSRPASFSSYRVMSWQANFGYRRVLVRRAGVGSRPPSPMCDMIYRCLPPGHHADPAMRCPLQIDPFRLDIIRSPLARRSQADHISEYKGISLFPRQVGYLFE